MKKFNMFLICLLAFTAGNSMAEGVGSLSEDTRSLLRAEMIALDSGFKRLFTEYYSGNLEEVVRIAKDIEDSFILKKQLTQEQKHELHSVLPAEFLELDTRFHYNAGMLAQAAKQRKTELVGFYFSELAQGCLGCHSKYAKESFKGMSGLTDDTNDHH